MIAVVEVTGNKAIVQEEMEVRWNAVVEKVAAEEIAVETVITAEAAVIILRYWCLRETGDGGGIVVIGKTMMVVVVVAVVVMVVRINCSA